MPTLPRSPDSSIHSWSFVYLRPAGYDAIESPGPAGAPALLLSFVERHRHDARARATAANVDVELGARSGLLHRHVGHPDRLLEIRRLRPAGHDASFRVAQIHIVAVARDAAIR